MGAQAIAVVGPTASGKTHRAVAIAREIGGEIISADSRQVYRGMTIGTGKDIGEYDSVPYHLIDIAPAGSKYNLHQFLKDFNAAYNDILGRGMVPVICGGSGMYVENALKGIKLPDVPADEGLRKRLGNLDIEELKNILSKYKALHNTTDVDTRQRAIRAIEIQEFYRSHPQEAKQADAATAEPLDCVVVGVDVDRDTRRSRITRRLHQRLDEGLVEEVETLLESGIQADDLIYYGLEYKYVTEYVIGGIERDTMVKELETAIHQFAKRQMTWFRGMEKRGIHIHWLSGQLSDPDFVAEAIGFLRKG